MFMSISVRSLGVHAGMLQKKVDNDAPGRGPEAHTLQSARTQEGAALTIPVAVSRTAV
jgi:hypothetical protein